MTNSSEVACPRTEDEDLVRRYLAGALPEDEAEAFEAHYFECERCWHALNRSLELRAAFADDSPRAAAEPVPTGRLRGTRWWPLAAAALMVLLVGTWRITSEPAGPVRAIDPVVRAGPDARFPVRWDLGDGSLRAAWPSVPGADVYRIRVFTMDGALLAEREVSETRVAIETDSLRQGSGPGALYADVEAQDALRRTIARSGLHPLPPPDLP